ncbi:MAG: V-type proton ATPase subunit E [Oscillospiraceae bacterium]|jgi:vacuolar-type H+-ATPase subunit E/Vma4|nr:V-type proton ATPase subunit E [Oscillospiraceae bacterium]
MDNVKKQNNFLNAIQKYASEQKKQMIADVEKFKAIEMKKAENEGLRDAHLLIQKEIEIKRNEITAQIARQEHESLVAIYKRRQEIVAEVFDAAKNKLVQFVQTPDYKTGLLRSAKAIADTFGKNDAAVYLAKQDMPLAAELKPLFGGKTEFFEDEQIELGGVKAVCKALKIIADETLDSKLALQVEWFTLNSGLKVM